MGKKQSGIAFGQRTKQKGASDLDQLVSLRRFLSDRFHMDFKREWYIGFGKEDGLLYRIDKQVGRNEVSRFTWRNPDLLCVSRSHGIIIVELDGAIHDRKVEKTKERNRLFRNAGIKLIVLNIADIRELGKTIKEELECQMLKIMGSGCEEY